MNRFDVIYNIYRALDFCAENDCHKCPKVNLCTEIFGEDKEDSPFSIIIDLSVDCKELIEREELN